MIHWVENCSIGFCEHCLAMDTHVDRGTALQFVERHGIVLESAHGPVVSFGDRSVFGADDILVWDTTECRIHTVFR
jgi:hypothetical protein